MFISRFARVLFSSIAFAFIICGCSNDLSKSEKFFGTESLYGSVTVSNIERAVYASEIKSAVVTVSGYDASGKSFSLSSGSVPVSLGKGKASVNKVPVCKNAVVTVSAYSDASSSTKISGVVMYALTDIVAGNNDVTVNWNTTAEGMVFAEIGKNTNTSKLTAAQVSSIKNAIPSVKGPLVAASSIASDFKSNNLKSKESYILQPVEVSVVAQNLSGYSIQIGDPVSEIVDGSASCNVQVVPGNWTIYVLDSSNNVVKTALLSVEEGDEPVITVNKSSGSLITGKIIVNFPAGINYTNAHMWGGDISQTKWPGKSFSNGVLEVSGTKTKIIFNDGSKQTKDLYVTEGEWNYIGGETGTEDTDGSKISSNFEKVSNGTESVTIKVSSGTSGVKIHLNNTGWSSAYVYGYTGSTSVTSKWPGEKMSSDGANFIFSTDNDYSSCNLIFNDSNGSQYPGKDSSVSLKLPSGAKEVWFDYSTKTWYTENPDKPVLPSCSISPSSGNLSVGSSITVSVKNGNDVLTSAEVVLSGDVSKTYSLSDFSGNSLVIDLASIGITGVGKTIDVSSKCSNSVGESSPVTASFTTVERPKLLSDWNEIRMYQVMVSSFQDGDPSIGYTNAYGPSSALKGGDLQGIINALDYIKDLGINALWMTPVFNSNGDSALDSTGYFAYDYFNIDPKFGTNDLFDELVSECHKRDIAVILDGVFGHNKGSVAPSPNRKGILNPGIMPSTSNPVNYKDNSDSIKYYSDVARYWITEHKIDGWRFDQCYQLGFGENALNTVGDRCDGCDRNHWYDIRKVVEAAAASNGTKGNDWGTLGYMVGEHWRGDASLIQKGSVEGGSAPGFGLPGCFDFPSYYQVVGAFAQEYNGKHSDDISVALEYIYKTASKKGYSCLDDDGSYKQYYPNLMLSNHDLFRVGDLIYKRYKDQAQSGDYFESENYIKRNKVMLAVQGAFTGPITIYYGDEIGDHVATTTSGWDSDNVARSTGKISGFNAREKAIHDFEKKVLETRSVHPALWNGSNEAIVKDSDFYVAEKKASGEIVYVAFNYSLSAKTFSASGTDLLSGSSFAGTVTVPALTAMYILAE